MAGRKPDKEGLCSKIPILTYHSIDRSGSIISVTPEKFKAHIQFLADNGFQAISLGEIAHRIRQKQGFPPKSVALTFDDGFRNFYSDAFPILQQFRFTATVFLVTGHCGGDNQWVGQPKRIPCLQMLEWDQIIKMAGEGIEFGAHTMSHPDLTMLPLGMAREQIERSKATLESRLGKPVTYFAYPYGKYNPAIQQLVKEKFEGSCSVELGYTTNGTDPYSLSRIDMVYFANNSLFQWFGTPMFSWYIAGRRKFRQLRGTE